MLRDSKIEALWRKFLERGDGWQGLDGEAFMDAGSFRRGRG